MDNDRFTFFASYRNMFKHLNKEQKADMIDAILGYAFDGTEPIFDDEILYALFEAIRPNIDSSVSRMNNSRKGGQKSPNSKNNSLTSKSNSLTSKSETTSKQIEEEIEEEKEKEVEIENEAGNKNNILASSPEDSKPVFQLPLIDKTLFNVTQSDVDKYRSLYPAVDIEQEFRNMIGWCDGNPTKLKTKTGIKRFINNWLSSTQNKPRSKPGRASPSSVNQFQEAMVEEIMKGKGNG